MPVVGIPIKQLKDLIGHNLDNEKIVSCCQEIGCDVEEFTSINRIKCSRCSSIQEFTRTEAPPKGCDVCQQPFDTEGRSHQVLESEEVIRLDLLADRPDNFDAGGLARSIRGYLGYEPGLPSYTLEDSGCRVEVDKSTAAPESYRPAIVCAVIRDVHFNDETLKNVMKLQENLHWALGRDRKYASIGVYNLDTVGTKFHYTTVSPTDFRFIPLGAAALTDEYRMSPREILEKHPKGMAYAHLLAPMQRYPLLKDEKGVVLSMPPIINSEDTKVTIDTTNLFIDVTGLRLEVIGKVLNILITSVKETIPSCRLCSVEIHDPGGSVRRTPEMEPADFAANFDNCRKLVGVDLADDQIVTYLRNMRYAAVKDGATCRLKVPCYRSDIIHEYDIIEDLAIGYGYKNIAPRTIQSYSIGQILPAQRKQQILREIMAGLGFLETLNIMLTCEKRAYETLNLPVEPARAIIENPISTDQTIFRTELLSGLLETLAHNTNNELPQRIFEVGEILFLDERAETGTREEVALGVTIAASKAGFADIKAVLQSLLRELAVAWTVTEYTSPLYLQGRACRILIGGQAAGHMGEIHPEILERLHIYNPVAALELNFTRAGLLQMPV